MRKKISLILTAILLFCSLAACGNKNEEYVDDGKIQIVTTVFPAYDFAREIGGDRASVTLLIPPGSEIHSYEPTPQDIIKIQNCDLFIYNGGESDKWVEGVLESLSGERNTIAMLQCVTALEEEIKEGMYSRESGEDGEGEPEYDEHVWTSPKNAAIISAAIADSLSEIQSDGAPYFRERLKAYSDRLNELDAAFREAVANGERRTLIFADRFPVRYFTEEYGLDYFAAYPGCAEEAEPSAKTVAFLIDRVREDKTPYVLYIEFSNEKMADVICEETGCGKLLFHSAHNVSKADMENGVTYLGLMEKNVETIKEALG